MPLLEEGEMMQGDGPRQCKFGKNYYQNSENWHPRVPLVGEMKCITCWCDVSALFPIRQLGLVNQRSKCYTCLHVVDKTNIFQLATRKYIYLV